MWYFAWILGVTLAVLLAVLNAMICEVGDNRRLAAPADAGAAGAKPPPGGPGLTP